MSEDISFWLHCKKCLNELPVGMSPKEYSKQQSGITPDGEIIVWCNRHNCDVARFVLDEAEMEQFEGATCPGCNDEGCTASRKSH